LNRQTDQLQYAGIETLIAGPDSVTAFRKFWTKENLSFIGLPDPTHVLSNLYSQDVKLLKLGRLPAQVLIDKSGIIKFIHYGNSMKDIPPVDISSLKLLLN